MDHPSDRGQQDPPPCSSENAQTLEPGGRPHSPSAAPAAPPIAPERPDAAVSSQQPATIPAPQQRKAKPKSGFRAAERKVQQVAQKIHHDQRLTRSQRIRLSQTFHRELFPPRKRGRRPLARITRATADYVAGKRGVALYRTHIPRWNTMAQWQRDREARRLMQAIRSRIRRAGKRSRS